VDRDEFERMKDEYYGLRGWDIARGVQKRSKLEELGLAFVADDLAKSGLVT
jgi:aldehyde:ferredoxin oxidoreductase